VRGARRTARPHQRRAAPTASTNAPGCSSACISARAAAPRDAAVPLRMVLATARRRAACVRAGGDLARRGLLLTQMRVISGYWSIKIRRAGTVDRAA
jgi:hypothetical protein